jgi:hypothetical protein
MRANFMDLKRKYETNNKDVRSYLVALLWPSTCAFIRE